MSDFFSNCLAAMATLLKKQKPIAFKMAMIDKLLDGENDVDDDGDFGVDRNDCDFIVGNADDRVDVDNNDYDRDDVDNDDHLDYHLLCLGMVTWRTDKSKPIGELQLQSH